jgi:acetylornithine deacetylase
MRPINGTHEGDMKNTIEDVNNWIDSNKEYILETLSGLIQIRTENNPPDGNEKPGQEYLYNKVSEFIPKKNNDLFDLDDVPGIREHGFFDATIDGIERNYRNRPNLVSKLEGTGNGKVLAFSGHMDVVPVVEKKWEVFEDPFSGGIKGGRMYGRGIADMKAGTLSGFMALKCLKDLNIRLKGDVIAESVVDEEYGGVNGTVACRLRNPNVDFAILAEPSNLAPITAVAGGAIWKISVDEKGPGGYSQLVNPIYKLAGVVDALREFESHFFKESIYPENYCGEHDLKIHLFLIHAGGRNYLENASYTPSGGCLYFYIPTLYTMPEQKVREDFINFMTARFRANDVFKSGLPTFETATRWLGAVKTDTSHQAFRIIQDVYSRLNMPFKEAALSLPCDAFAFPGVSNTEVIVLGPKGSNYHGIDEYVEIDSLFELIKIMVLTAIEYCG